MHMHHQLWALVALAATRMCVSLFAQNVALYTLNLYTLLYTYAVLGGISSKE